MKTAYWFAIVLSILYSGSSRPVWGESAEGKGGQLLITGKIGTVFSIQYCTNASLPGTWKCLAFVKTTASEFTWNAPVSDAGKQFVYRAIPDVRSNMVFISPGTFLLGDPTKTNYDGISDCVQTKVTVTRGYWMATHHVTQNEYQALVGSNPSLQTNDFNLPVERLSWFEATNYCWLLTQRELRAGRISPGCEYRLPTEAEWEYASRAWAVSRSVAEDDPSTASVTNYAWRIIHGTDSRTAPQNLAEPSGLYDTRGMTSDWCQDWYGPYQGGEVVDPQGPPDGMTKVRCGGNLGSRFGCCAPGAINPLTKRNVCVPAAGGVNFSCRIVLAPSRQRMNSNTKQATNKTGTF